MTSDRARRAGELFGYLALMVHRSSQDAGVLLRREGLNPAQFQLLRAVRDRPGSVQRELGGRFAVTEGNVSLLVSKLTAAGWLRREAHGAANRIWLTDAGAQLVERLEPEQAAFLLERFGSLTEAELDEFHRLAQKAWEGLPPAP